MHRVADLAPPKARIWTGVAATVVGVAVLSGAMIPLRDHLSVATTALVLVVPVVVGVTLGGFPAGLVGVVAGFLAYDYFFIPPYYTLSVGAAQNWVALGVYAVVMVLVSQVVAALQRARITARRREQDARRLFEISDLLIGDRPMPELLVSIVRTVRSIFDLTSVALLLPRQGQLGVVASDGEPLPEEWLRRIVGEPGFPTTVPVIGAGPLQTVTLATAARPIGILALVGAAQDAHGRQLLATFANHAALAVERAELEEQAMRTKVLEQVDRWRSALVGSVSHDLRTPLASIKAAVSYLADPTVALEGPEQQELLGTIDGQADRLTRLVANLLDMTRIEAGALAPRRQPLSLAEVVNEAASDAVRRLIQDRVAKRVEVHVSDDLPPVAADPTLTGQVLANLLENAVRHAPSGSAIVVAAGHVGDQIHVSVADRGPGIPEHLRSEVFEAFHRLGQPGPHVAGMGLGLAIAKAFVEVQGGSIEAGDNPGGGARFSFSLPIFPIPAGVA
ncbi:MAG: ATP-binding protein [Acidimicrobiales bacterium]